MTHTYYWGNNPVRAARKGQRCRVVAKGALKSILVEFEDGQKVVTMRGTFRRLANMTDAPEWCDECETGGGHQPGCSRAARIKTD